MSKRFGRAAACAAIVSISLTLSVTDGNAQTLPTETPTPVTLTSTPAPTQTATTPTAEPTPTITPAVPSPTPTVVPTPFSSGVPCATDDPSTRHVERTERRGRDDDGEGNDDQFATGNGRNEVVVHNCTDFRLRVRASIQLNTIPGRVVAPLNLAYAEGSCIECSTLAVALQVDLYSGERARDVRPEN